MSAQGLIMLHIQTNNNLDIGTAPSTANLRMTLSQRGWLKRQNLSLDGPCETWQGQETLYNKETCRVLHFGWNNPTVSPAKKDLHITTGVRLRKLRRCSLLGSNANHVLGWTKRAMAGQSCDRLHRGVSNPHLWHQSHGWCNPATWQFCFEQKVEIWWPPKVLYNQYFYQIPPYFS